MSCTQQQQLPLLVVVTLLGLLQIASCLSPCATPPCPVCSRILLSNSANTTLSIPPAANTNTNTNTTTNNNNNGANVTTAVLAALLGAYDLNPNVVIEQRPTFVRGTNSMYYLTSAQSWVVGPTARFGVVLLWVPSQSQSPEDIDVAIVPWRVQVSDTQVKAISTLRTQCVSCKASSTAAATATAAAAAAAVELYYNADSNLCMPVTQCISVTLPTKTNTTTTTTTTSGKTVVSSSIEVQAPTSTSDRVCRNCNSECTSGQFSAASCTPSDPVTCADCSIDGCHRCAATTIVSLSGAISTSSTTCTECRAPLLLLPQTGKCVASCPLNLTAHVDVGQCLPCNSSEYWNATASVCRKCHASCVTCTGASAAECSSCLPTHGLFGTKCFPLASSVPLEVYHYASGNSFSLSQFETQLLRSTNAPVQVLHVSNITNIHTVRVAMCTTTQGCLSRLQVIQNLGRPETRTKLVDRMNAVYGIVNVPYGQTAVPKSTSYHPAMVVFLIVLLCLIVLYTVAKDPVTSCMVMRRLWRRRRMRPTTDDERFIHGAIERPRKKKIMYKEKSRPIETEPLIREDVVKWWMKRERVRGVGYDRNGDVFPWLMGLISIDSSVAILHEAGDGAFHIFLTDDFKGYILGVNHSGNLRHFEIQVSANHYNLMGLSKHWYGSLSLLVDHYSRHPIMKIFRLVYASGDYGFSYSEMSALAGNMSSDPSDLDITTMALFQSNDLVDVIDQDDDGDDNNVRVEVVDGIGNKRSGSWTDLPFQPIYERLPDAATTPAADADRKRKQEEERFYELIHPADESTPVIEFRAREMFDLFDDVAFSPTLASRPGHGAAFNTPSHAAVASPTSNLSTPATETSSLNTTATTPANTTAASNALDITNSPKDNNSIIDDNSNININSNNGNSDSNNNNSNNSNNFTDGFYGVGTMSTDVTGLIPAGMVYDLATPDSVVNGESGGNDTDDARSDSTLMTAVELAASADSLVTNISQQQQQQQQQQKEYKQGADYALPGQRPAAASASASAASASAAAATAADSSPTVDSSSGRTTSCSAQPDTPSLHYAVRTLASNSSEPIYATPSEVSRAGTRPASHAVSTTSSSSSPPPPPAAHASAPALPPSPPPSEPVYVTAPVTPQEFALYATASALAATTTTTAASTVTALPIVPPAATASSATAAAASSSTAAAAAAAAATSISESENDLHPYTLVLEKPEYPGALTAITVTEAYEDFSEQPSITEKSHNNSDKPQKPALKTTNKKPERSFWSFASRPFFGRSKHSAPDVEWDDEIASQRNNNNNNNNDEGFEIQM